MQEVSKSNEGLALFLDRLFENEGAEGVVSSMSFLFGAFAVTVDGVVIGASDSFLNLVGYSRSELYGMSAVELVAPSARRKLEKRFSQDFIGHYELPLLTKESKIIHTLVRPRIFFSGGRKYRLAQFIDNTATLSLARSQLENFMNVSTALMHAFEYRDPYTQGHMSRVEKIAVKISRLLKLDEQSIGNISLGACLHDVGKIAVPIEILTKPSRLEDHEWAFIKKHPEAGYKILAGTHFVKEVEDIVLLHHENQDGSGYPHGLKGEEIPLGVAIVSVADGLDAIAGTRPYRKASSFIEAIKIMEGEANKYRKEVLVAARQLVESGQLNGRELGVMS